MDAENREATVRMAHGGLEEEIHGWVDSSHEQLGYIEEGISDRCSAAAENFLLDSEVVASVVVGDRVAHDAIGTVYHLEMEVEASAGFAAGGQCSAVVLEVASLSIHSKKHSGYHSDHSAGCVEVRPRKCWRNALRRDVEEDEAIVMAAGVVDLGRSVVETAHLVIVVAGVVLLALAVVYSELLAMKYLLISVVPAVEILEE
jgi:hypothetical protein